MSCELYVGKRPGRSVLQNPSKRSPSVLSFDEISCTRFSLEHTVLRFRALSPFDQLDGVSLVDLHVFDDASNVTTEKRPGNFCQCRKSIEAVGDRTLHHGAGHTIDPRVNIFCRTESAVELHYFPLGDPY